MTNTCKISVSALVFLSAGLICTALPAVSGEKCKSADLEWPTWHDYVLAVNRGTDFFDLRGGCREKLLKALRCPQSGKNNSPYQIMAFHCTGNTKVLIAFVNAGCVTWAKEITSKITCHT